MTCKELGQPELWHPVLKLRLGGLVTGMDSARVFIDHFQFYSSKRKNQILYCRKPNDNPYPMGKGLNDLIVSKAEKNH